MKSADRSGSAELGSLFWFKTRPKLPQKVARLKCSGPQVGFPENPSRQLVLAPFVRTFSFSHIVRVMDLPKVEQKKLSLRPEALRPRSREVTLELFSPKKTLQL